MNVAEIDSIVIFFGMSVVLSMLGVVVFLMGISYQRLSRKNHKLYEELTRINQDIKNQHEKIILDAQAQAQNILADASKRSQTLVQASDIFAQEYKTQFRARLMQILAKEEEEFQKVYEEVKLQSNKVVSNISKDIESTLANEMKQMREVMLTQMQKGMEEYKKASYSKLEEEVATVVDLIAKNVLKKSLNKEEHKRLVIDALNEAKQHNVL